MSEKLCLNWNDFQENVNAAFGSLRGNHDFADVTLVCDDGQQIEAHKVILAALSPFFQNLFKRNRHPHPLIYMRGMKSDDLLAIIDLLYCGEANVYQENLDSFLAIAEDLKLEGLMGQDPKRDTSRTFSDGTPQELSPRPVLKKESLIYNQIETNLKPEKDAQQPPSVQTNSEQKIAIPNFVSEDLKELDEKVKSMIEIGHHRIQSGKEERRAYICKVCGKEGAGIAIRDHIEANHLEGVSLPCNVCGKTFRSRIGLRKHKRAHS